MKRKILFKLRQQIKNQYPNYSNDKLDEIMYGIEGIYLTLEKAVIIFILAAILGIFKELFFLLLAFNFIRLFGFGIHASKSYVCLITSSVLFIGFAFLCKYVNLNINNLIIIYFIIITIILLFAPADTVKRPLIQKNKRMRLKILSIIITILYFIISLIFIKNSTLVNYLCFGLIIECLLINPITYKLFNTPFNNYKKMV